MHNLFPGPVGWKPGFEQDEGAERRATRRFDVVSISMNVESQREKMRSDRREERKRDLEMQRQEQQLGLDQQG
jgi:hypothetical protein